MKLGLVQYNPLWENKNQNIEKLNQLLAGSTEKVDVLIFPEMTLTGFTMHTEKNAEEIKGDSFSFFKKISRSKNADVLAGIITAEGRNYYNNLVHINKKGEVQTAYRKIHPFGAEKKYYKRGGKPSITAIGKFKIGLSVCYDLRFPELYRYYAKEKVHLIVNIANWPIDRVEHWRVLLRARAIENQCYVAGVNRIGSDPKLQYPGYSSVFDPMGEELISSAHDEKVICCSISLSYVNKVRSSLPFIEDIFLI